MCYAALRMGRWVLRAIAGGLLCFVAWQSLAAPDKREPALVLWTWERSEDLRFLDDRSDTQIAFLAGTIRLNGDAVSTRPRYAPLIAPMAIRRIPVVRIEAAVGVHAASFSAAQRRELIAAIDGLVRLDGADTLQIDFDAPVSARPFYRAVLADVRARLSPEAKLSMTALASWCLGDRWLDDVAADEVVPMFFRMGRDDGAVRAWLASSGSIDPRCAGSAGLTLDEAEVALPTSTSLYVFNPRAWTAGDYGRALDLVAAEPGP